MKNFEKTIIVIIVAIMAFASFGFTNVESANANIGYEAFYSADMLSMDIAKQEIIPHAERNLVMANDQLEAQIFADLHSGFPEYAHIERTVEAIKELNDFAHNLFYVVELAPTGFIVYDRVFSRALIMNIHAQSPWLGIYEGLIFAGAGQYFIRPAVQPRAGHLFVHAVLGTEFHINDSQLADIVESSTIMANTIENEIDIKQMSMYEPIMPLSTIQRIAVPRAYIIRDRHTATLMFDFANDVWRYVNWNQNGNCGYISAALLIYYQRRVRGFTQLAPRGFDHQLVRDIQGPRWNTTFGSDLQGAINDYVRARGRNDRAHVWYLPQAHSFYDRVREGRPIIFMGNVPHASGHAVVVTEVQRTRRTILGIGRYSDYYYWVHYGWGIAWNNERIANSTVWAGAKVLF